MKTILYLLGQFVKSDTEQSCNNWVASFVGKGESARRDIHLRPGICGKRHFHDMEVPTRLQSHTWMALLQVNEFFVLEFFVDFKIFKLLQMFHQVDQARLTIRTQYPALWFRSWQTKITRKTRLKDMHLRVTILQKTWQLWCWDFKCYHTISYHIIPTVAVCCSCNEQKQAFHLFHPKSANRSNRIKRLTLDSERQAIATANWCTQTGLPQNCSVPTFPIRWQKLQTPNSNRLNVANHKNAQESSTEKQTLTNCGMQKDISNGQRMPERSLGKTHNQLLRQPEPNQI